MQVRRPPNTGPLSRAVSGAGREEASAPSPVIARRCVTEEAPSAHPDVLVAETRLLRNQDSTHRETRPRSVRLTHTIAREPAPPSSLLPANLAAPAASAPSACPRHNSAHTPWPSVAATRRRRLPLELPRSSPDATSTLTCHSLRRQLKRLIRSHTRRQWVIRATHSVTPTRARASASPAPAAGCSAVAPGPAR